MRLYQFKFVIRQMMRNLIGKRFKTFNIIKLIGQGQTGTVFESLDDRNNNLVAVKAMYIKKFNFQPKLKEQVQTEISVLKNCNNPNVIKFIDSFQTNEYFFIVTQYCNGGSVDQYLQGHHLTEDQAVVFLKQILNGFKGLHEIGAMHRDFKADNILIHNGICKIADLGSSKQMANTQTTKTFIGTPLTNAPQILEQKQYGYEADIWSIGVVFYQMIYNEYPYHGSSVADLIYQIKLRRPCYDGINISLEAKDFIEKCLVYNPSKRIKWKQIYDHPLICDKNGNLRIAQGNLKRVVSINTLTNNKRFYQNSGNFDTTKLNKIIQQGINNSNRTLTEDEVRPSAGFDSLIAEADKIKELQQIRSRFDNLYVGKRSNLMFFSKFIQPYIRSLSKIPIGHQILAFLMCKKTYIELDKFYQDLILMKPIFQSQPGFQYYINLQNYSNLRKLVYKDLEILESTCREQKALIRMTSIEVMNQFDYTRAYSSCFDRLVGETCRQYCWHLCKNIGEMQGQTRINLIKVHEALNYYINSSKPNSQQFDRMISLADLNKLQKIIRQKSKTFS